MAHSALKIVGGVVQNETPALNEAGISQTQLIRLKPDPKGLTLPEKLGGWSQFYGTQITQTVRALWGWQDTNASKWIAYGTAGSPANLVAIHCTTNQSTGLTTADNASGPPLYFNMTPSYGTNSVPVNFTTTYGTSAVYITDSVDTGITSYDNVYIATPISAGGITLSGLYQCYNQGSSTVYYVNAQNVLDNFILANYTTLPISPTPFTAFTFNTIVSGTVTLNVTWPTNSQPPPGESITLSGFSGGTAAAFSSFSFGSITSNVVTVTGTFSGLAPNLGQTVTLAGFSPSAWNGTFTVCAVSSTSISFVNSSVSATWASAGTITFSSPWNGIFTITGSTSSTVQFYNPAVTSSWSTKGAIANDGILPIVSTTSGSNLVTVAFPDHGLSVGSTFAILTPTTVGGIPLFGNYVVNTVISNGAYNSYQFTVYTNNQATSTQTSLLNYGNVEFVYSYGAGPPQAAAGYGTSPYGYGGYGTGVPATPAVGSPISATDWSLDNWGQQLVAVPVNFFFNGTAQFQPIFIFDPTTQQQIATPIPNSPSVNTGAFVAMPQRQIIAWGSSFTGIVDPLLVRWCDVNNYNTWVAQITNQAGSYRLPTGSQIVGAMQGPQQGLLWTDIALWAMQYIGPPYIYSFNQLAAGCGLIGRHAMGTLNGVVYWMGTKQFFSLSGNGVTPIPCPIWDVVFQDLDLANVAKITCAVNSLFEEITWYYPVVNGTKEVSNYIRFNAQLNSWDFGVLARSAWLDTTVLGSPIGYDPVNQYIYQHEINTNADGAAMASSFTTGYFALSEGDNKVFIDEFWPDMKWGYYGQSQDASVQITFNAVDFPGQAPTTYGPFTVTQSTTWFNPRIRTRLISITVSSNDLDSFWRLGNMRYRAIPDGRY